MYNIDNIILNLLSAMGCTIKIEAGIVYVTTPDGEKWDFTLPKKQ